MKPEKPLVIKPMSLKTQKKLLRLDEKKLSEADMIEEVQAILAGNCNWTFEELDELTSPELMELLAEFKSKNQAKDVLPLPSGPSSGDGVSAEGEKSPDGLTTS